MINRKVQIALQAFFVSLLLIMLWLYATGYENSIGWEVTSTAEVLEFPAISIEGELLDFQVTGEKYLLTESYSGGRISRNYVFDGILLGIAWLGLLIALTGASFLKRGGFILSLILFTLMINRLNLYQIGLFDIRSKMAMLIPFFAVAGPLIFFHEYRQKTSFVVRLATITLLSLTIVFFGVNEPFVFVDHLASHSLFSFAIAGLIFLLIITEENIFGVLYLVTKGKGGRSNHLHFIVLGLIYLVNLVLYYLNKSGYVPNSFFFFDPYILLALSSMVAIWSLGYKQEFLTKYLPSKSLLTIFLGTGIILFSLLSLSFFRGIDAIYESFHYFILYFHIGFGAFFFIYIVVNFIDALVEGFEVFKIVYKERHFPYVSARLGGLVVVLAFYFLATQEPYELLKSGYYVHLASQEETIGHPDLAIQYYQQAGFLGYNTHYPNYKLAWNYSDQGNEYLTKTYFEKAAARYPSPFAFVNYTNLDMDINRAKVQSALERAVQQFRHGELKNNFGILRLKNNEPGLALEQFEYASSSNSWNQAPLLNKWAALKKLGAVDSIGITDDYQDGNYGVRANLLTSVDEGAELDLILEDYESAPVLHRRAYLLNATHTFDYDTISKLIPIEIDASINANFNDALRKSLAIYYYRKGEVNKVFHQLDQLQANTYSYDKATYLNDLGKVALDQEAYLLALDYFDQAIENNSVEASINRLEVLAWLGRADEIPTELLKVVENDPGLTAFANQLLTKLNTGNFERRKEQDTDLNLKSLSDNQLIELGYQNAFDESTVLEVVDELSVRGNIEAYNVILEAVEVNPYDVSIMMKYALVALEQNLISYADEMIPRIRELAEASTFEAFNERFTKRKSELGELDWQ